MKDYTLTYITKYIYTTMIYVEEYLEEYMGVMFIKVDEEYQDIGIKLFFNKKYDKKKFVNENLSRRVRVLVEARYMMYHKIIEDYIK